VGDCLRRAAGAGGGAGLFPEFFPVPDSIGYIVSQWESDLMREHADLATVVGFVGKHVAQHFETNRPGWGVAVSAKFLDAALRGAERFREHFGAARGAFGQRGAGLLRSAAGAVQLSRNFEVRSGQPDPLGADVVHVGEDGDDRAGLVGRFGAPGARVEMFDKLLIHALIGGKDLDCGPADLRLNVVLTRSHSPLL
jgi:hypothetical protein